MTLLDPLFDTEQNSVNCALRADSRARIFQKTITEISLDARKEVRAGMAVHDHCKVAVKVHLPSEPPALTLEVSGILLTVLVDLTRSQASIRCTRCSDDR